MANFNDDNYSATEHLQKIIDKFAININELLYNIDIHENTYGAPYISYNDGNYNAFANENLNSMSTYNALRKLYRDIYDLRSKGKRDYSNGIEKIIGREINPITNYEMNINYYNDLNISPIFIYKEDNNFSHSICDVIPNTLFVFTEKGYFKDFYENRKNTIITIESTPKNNKHFTSDFFSFRMQVNPLLYAYMSIDEEGNYRILDADYFLERNAYNNLFNKQNTIMKGNQYCIPFWKDITDCQVKRTDYYDDNDEYTGSKNEFKNKKWLFEDSYTNQFLYILQNSRQYYTYYEQNDFWSEEERNKENLDLITEKDSRGHLFYDTLLDVLFSILKNNDNINEVSYKYLMGLSTIPKIRNKQEIEGFPFDIYAANNKFFPYSSEDKRYYDDIIDNKCGERVINEYRRIYDIIFGQLFRIIPYLLSPSYKFDIQSPAMSIFFGALTIMAIKDIYHNNKDDYNNIINNLIDFTNNIDNIDGQELHDSFDKIFKDIDISKYTDKYLKIILPALTINSTAINDPNNKDFDGYMSQKARVFVETNNNEKTISKSLILLTELFHKLESIRYFDASTFSIDYTLFTDNDKKEIGRTFADSLLESCYIHMNTLGTEVFFNGKAPTGLYRSYINNISKGNIFKELLGLDTTKVSKNNINLFKIMNSENKDDINSYHSYLAVINLFVSLAYSFRITVDSLTINLYSNGPYGNNTIRRPQSFFTITKRYAMHMMVINNNSYGIYNDVRHSDNENYDAELIMAAQRVKWLTYGLHLRVWYNDAYFYYSNYKQLFTNLNDYNTVVNNIRNLYSEHTINKELPLFRETERNIIVPLPNINLSLAPMAGSYTINTVIACIRYYIDNDNIREYAIDLINHGLKDIIVGDSISSILGERQKYISELILAGKRISYNNINGKLQKLYDNIDSVYYELAITGNLDFLINKIIRPYFKNNPDDCRLLNDSMFNIHYDSNYFNNEYICKNINFAYENTWMHRIIKLIFKSNNKSQYMNIIGRMLNIHRVAQSLYHTRVIDGSISNLIEYWMRYYNLSSLNSIFINDYKEGLTKLVYKNNLYSVFKYTNEHLFYGINKNAIANILCRNRNVANSFEDIITLGMGVTAFALYESPLSLMLYNNLPFEINNIETPTLHRLFDITMYIMGHTYGLNKRMIVDLNYNGDPIKKFIDERNLSINNTEDIERARRNFANESYGFYALGDAYGSGANAEIYQKIGDKYKFATIMGQFFDYDFIYSQLCNILNNNQYIARNEKDAIKFFNDYHSNLGNDYNSYVAYCKLFDTSVNQLTHTINTMNELKRGTLSINKIIKEKIVPTIDAEQQEYNDAIEIIDGKDTEEIKAPSDKIFTYITMNAIGITEAEYQEMSQKEKADYDKQIEAAKQLKIDNENEYLDKVTALENQLTQLRRAHKINNNEPVISLTNETTSGNMTLSEKENYTLIAEKGLDYTMLTRLTEISNCLNSINETLKDFKRQSQSNHNEIINAINSLNKNGANIIIEEDNNDSDSKEEPDSSEPEVIGPTVEVIDNNNDGYDWPTEDLIFGEPESKSVFELMDNISILKQQHQQILNDINRESINNNPIINTFEIKPIELAKSNKAKILKDPIVDFNNKTITIFNGNNKSITIDFNKDINLTDRRLPAPEICNYYSQQYNNIMDINDYYYLPIQYLQKIIPYIPNNNDIIDELKLQELINNKDNIINEYGRFIAANKDIQYQIIDGLKALYLGLPIYSNDFKNLIIVIDNIAIDFKQSIKDIIADIDNLLNYKSANKLKFLINRHKNFIKVWDNDNIDNTIRLLLIGDILNQYINTDSNLMEVF